MKFVCVSDTHGKHRQIKNIPDGDVFLHAGDITNFGELQILEDFNDWLGELPHYYKVVIPGNHDWSFERDWRTSAEILSNATCLRSEFVTIDGVHIYGEPSQPRFFDWAFNVDRSLMREVWERLPVDVNIDILLTHGPPLGVCDEAKRVNHWHEGPEVEIEHVGCGYQLALLQSRPDIKFCVCGHIHGSYGRGFVGGTEVINASICDEGYKPVNLPIVFEYEKP
jgi:Icc-related predicted phosphoesterase